MQLLESLTELLTIRLGRWFGVPVTLHWSWTVLLMFYLFSGWLALITFLGLFALVLAHEFGHVFAAQFVGQEVKGVVLFPIGGAALVEPASCPKKELFITFCGPLVNLLLVVPTCMFYGQGEPYSTIAVVNMAMLVFNLIPAFPMDGGRILRSTLNLLGASWLTATTWAVWTSYVFCVLFVGAAIRYSAPGMAMIAVFVAVTAWAELSVEREKPGSDGDTRNSQDGVAEMQRKIAAYERRKAGEAAE